MNLRPELIHLIGAYLDLPNFDKQLLSVLFYNCLNNEWFWKNMAIKINCNFFSILNLFIVKKYLIQNPNEINNVNEYDETLLYIACGKGNLDIVKYLIDQGEKINRVVCFGQTALHIACKKGYLDIVKYLVDNGANLALRCIYTPLHIACLDGNFEIVKYLIDNGADINMLDAWDRTPLNIAYEKKNNNKIVNYLIDNGAISRDKSCVTS